MTTNDAVEGGDAAACALLGVAVQVDGAGGSVEHDLEAVGDARGLLR